MLNTLHPTQVGYTPTGSAYQSTVVIGGNGTTNWEAIGFGVNGRPDYMERLVINLVTPSGGISRKGVLTMDVGNLISIINQHPITLATGFGFGFREILICEAGVTKNMIILSSQTYPTGSS